LDIAAGWSGSSGNINLRGESATITGANGVISYWLDRRIIHGSWLNESNEEIINDRLRNFIDTTGNTLPIRTPAPPEAPNGYMISANGRLVEK
jgi:hypothetical protein